MALHKIECYFIFSIQANSESMPNGVLTGNWGGPYYPFVSPTQWQGSVTILDRYMRGRNYGDTVKYGQCWVFSGLCTTCKVHFSFMVSVSHVRFTFLLNSYLNNKQHFIFT